MKLNHNVKYLIHFQGTTNSNINDQIQKLNSIKANAIKAIRDGKIFVLVGYWPVIRQNLKDRGWVEKIVDLPNKITPNYQELLNYAQDGNESERQILSYLVSTYPADFVFSAGRMPVTRYLHDFALWNRLNIGSPKDFTIKDGLYRCIEDSHFNTIENKSEISSPRSFVIENKIGFDEFIDEFYLTASRNLVYFLNEHLDTFVVIAEDDFETEDAKLIELVCDYVTQTVQISRDHIDIEELFIPIIIEPIIWTQIMQISEDILEKGNQITMNSESKIRKLKQKIQETTKISLKHWPFTKHDGCKNIWVAKPTNQCGGVGVTPLNNLEKIIEHVNTHSLNSRMILQKYIERPLLINQCKFDIRYFFIISTDLHHVKLWEHEMCYLRFSTTEFNLNDLNPQIHVTNHSLQRNVDKSKRSDKVPAHNMLHLSQFQEYLASIGHENVWKDKIYPAIKRNLSGLVLTSIEEIEYKAKRFQIFGADFLITDDFEVYLIECNHSPALSTNMTAVTEVVFKNICEDALKVVLDYPSDQRSSTGGFHLILKVDVPASKATIHDMTIQGKAVNVTDLLTSNQKMTSREQKSDRIKTRKESQRKSSISNIFKHQKPGKNREKK
uniref:CSON015356 protein n=1 Tax=Culicoides sonorensis TaxID=179676 RepID=A0A336MD44_CULSO